MIVSLVDAHGRIAIVREPAIPAAHSMDTEWYAVDANGRVGHMQSGEEGSVPWDAHRTYWDELLADIVIARIMSTSPDEPWSERATLQRALDGSTDPVERSLVKSILDGDDASRIVYLDWLEANAKTVDGFPREHVVFEVDGAALRRIDVDALPEQWDCVLRFSHPEYLAMFREDTWRYGGRWRALEERLGMPDAAAVSELYNYGFMDFWEAGELTAVYVIPSHRVEPSELGLYDYSCSFSGPYYRRSVPRRPLLVEHLPAGLRDELARVRFPRAFAQAEQFSPESFADCQIYGE